MYAILRDGEIVSIIKNTFNVKLPCGDTVTDLRLLDEDQKIAHGIYDYYEEPYPPLFQKVISTKYDINHLDRNVKLIYEVEDQDLEYLKKEYIEIAEKQAQGLLQSTNFIVLQALELKQDIPLNVASYRASVRATLASLKANIMQSESAEEVANCNIQWPTM